MNFPPLLQEFIVQKLIRLVHSGLSLPVQKAALQCLEQLHKENVLFTYLKSHSEAELLDSSSYYSLPISIIFIAHYYVQNSYQI